MIDRITTQPLYAVQAHRYVHPDGRRGGNSAGHQGKDEQHDSTQHNTAHADSNHSLPYHELVIEEEHKVLHTELFDESQSYIHAFGSRNVYGKQNMHSADHTHDSHADTTIQATQVAAYRQPHQHSVTDERI